MTRFICYRSCDLRWRTFTLLLRWLLIPTRSGYYGYVVVDTFGYRLIYVAVTDSSWLRSYSLLVTGLFTVGYRYTCLVIPIPLPRWFPGLQLIRSCTFFGRYVTVRLPVVPGPRVAPLRYGQFTCRTFAVYVRPRRCRVTRHRVTFVVLTVTLRSRFGLRMPLPITFGQCLPYAFTIYLTR